MDVERFIDSHTDQENDEVAIQPSGESLLVDHASLYGHEQLPQCTGVALVSESIRATSARWRKAVVVSAIFGTGS